MSLAGAGRTQTTRDWRPRNPSTNKSPRQHAFTLVELLVAMTVTIAVLGGLVSVVKSFSASFLETTASAVNDQQLRQALDQVVSELRFVRLEGLVLSKPNAARSLSYSSVVGYDDVETISGPVQTLSLQTGRILLNQKVIAEGVSDLTFDLNGNLLTIVVSRETLVHTGRVVTRRIMTQLRL